MNASAKWLLGAGFEAVGGAWVAASVWERADVWLEPDDSFQMFGCPYIIASWNKLKFQMKR